MEYENVSKLLVEFVTTYGLKVIGAVLILILGRIGAGLGRSIVTKVMTRAKADPSVTAFVRNLTFILLIVFAVLAALAKFGVETTSFVAVLGAGAFAIGFALQGSLANFASGVLLLVLRPFKVGDFIDAAGVTGTVKEIQLFTTVLATPDNVKILIPNGKIYGDTIKNLSAYDLRRIDLVVGIAYGSSIEKAIRVIQDVLSSNVRVMKDPASQVAVSELADSSVNLVVRPWVETANYWDVAFEVMKSVKEACDANDIEIPFPQHVIHMLPGEGED
jgi:small conductance mechanosensitive channel